MLRFDFRDPLVREAGGLGIGLNVGDKQKKELCTPSDIEPQFPDHVVVVC
jgi:hypothetical protein